jgi:hypothetical protein
MMQDQPDLVSGDISLLRLHPPPAPQGDTLWCAGLVGLVAPFVDNAAHNQVVVGYLKSFYLDRIARLQGYLIVVPVPERAEHGFNLLGPILCVVAGVASAKGKQRPLNLNNFAAIADGCGVAGHHHATLALALTWALTLALALTLTLTLALTWALAPTLALTWAPTLALTWSLALTLALAPTLAHTWALALTLTLALAPTLTHTWALTLTHTWALTLTHTWALTLTHTWALTLTQTLALTCSSTHHTLPNPSGDLVGTAWVIHKGGCWLPGADVAHQSFNLLLCHMFAKSGHTRIWPPSTADNGIADKCIIVAGEKLLTIDGGANAPDTILAVARSAVCAIELLSKLHNGFGIVHIYWRGCGACWCSFPRTGRSLRCKIMLDIGHNLLNLPRFEHRPPARHRRSRHTIANRAGQHLVLFVSHIGSIQRNANTGAATLLPVAGGAVG